MSRNERNFFVYVVSDKPYGTIYTGVANDLARRIYEHKNGLFKGFTKRYGLKRLVYYEVYQNSVEAIAREKQLKKWNRYWKIDLIKAFNPDWGDLYEML